MNWNFLTSKIFWLDAAAIISGIIAYLTTNNLLTGNWLVLAGVAIVAIDLVVSQVLGSKVASLKKENAKLTTKIKKWGG